MAYQWIAVVVLSLLACIHIHAVPKDNENEKLITKLSADFHNILEPNRLQYGVMYMHPPNAKFNAITYVPKSPKPPEHTSPVTYPIVTQQNKDDFPFNYVATTPDFNYTYGPMMHKNHRAVLHTEDLSFNLVFPGMSVWYKNKYCKDPMYVYMYTYFLPCPRCTDFIKDFVKRNIDKQKKLRLYVGYGQLFGGNHEKNDTKEMAATSKRRDDLQKYLKAENGNLYMINRPTDEILYYLNETVYY